VFALLPNATCMEGIEEMRVPPEVNNPSGYTTRVFPDTSDILTLANSGTEVVPDPSKLTVAVLRTFKPAPQFPSLSFPSHGFSPVGLGRPG